MKTVVNPARASWSQLLKRPTMDLASIEALVRPVMEAVKNEGDAAIQRYTEKYDGVRLSEWAVSQAEFEAAEASVPAEWSTDPKLEQ